MDVIIFILKSLYSTRNCSLYTLNRMLAGSEVGVDPSEKENNLVSVYFLD